MEAYTLADILAPLFKLVTYGLSLILMIKFKQSGIRTSSVQWFFWLVLVIFQGFTFGSVINNPYNQGLSPNATNDRLLIVEYTTIFVIFTLNCFADVGPSYKDPRGRFIDQHRIVKMTTHHIPWSNAFWPTYVAG